MKKLFSLILFYLFVDYTNAQNNLLERYLSPEFKVDWISTNMMDIISRELRITDKRNEVIKKLSDIDVNLKKDRVIAEYAVQTFNSAYEQTLQEMNKYDYFSKWPNEVSYYGIDFLKQKGFTQIPQSINQYLPAAIQSNSQRLCQLYLRDLKDLVPSIQTQIENFAKERFSILKAKGVNNLETLNEYTKFAEEFTKQLQNLPAFFNEQSEYFKKEITAFAFTIRSKYPAIVASSLSDLENRSKKWNTEINNFEDNVLRKKIKEEIKKDKESFEKVKIAQQKLDEGIDTLIDLSKKYKQTLTNLEVKIKEDVAAGIQNKIEQYKQEYKKVSEKLNFVIGIAQDLNSGKLDINVAIEKMKDDAIKKLFGPEITKLKIPFTDAAGNIVSELNNVGTFTQVAFNFTSSLSNLGILKGPDAKRVQLFISKAIATVQVGTGIARIFSGDISGIFSVIGGLGGLFGGGGPSPEEQIMDMMQKNFEIVNQKLDQISEKIDKLSEQIYTLHKDMANSFQRVFNDLDEIKFTLDNVHEQARLQLFFEYNTCAIVNDKLYDSIGKWGYSQYLNEVPTEIGICLEGLNKLSLTHDDQYFLLNVNSNIYQSSASRYQDMKIYKPAFSYLEKTFKNNWKNIAIFGMQLPVKYVGDISLPFALASTNPPGQKDFGESSVLTQLFNPALIYEYVNLFSKLALFFEISWDDDRFRPEPLDKYLSWDIRHYKIKNEFQRLRVNKLLDVTNKAIFQQCLLSGHTIINNIAQSIKTESDITLLNDVLTNNKLLSQNFVEKILFEGMGLVKGDEENRNNTLYKMYVDIQNKIDSSSSPTQINLIISQLNAHITPEIPCSFTYDSINNKLTLKVIYVNSKDIKEVLLDIPPAEILLEGKMIYPLAVYDLLESRKILQDKLASLIFNEKLSSIVNTDQNKQLFKLLYKLDYEKK